MAASQRTCVSSLDINDASPFIYSQITLQVFKAPTLISQKKKKNHLRFPLIRVWEEKKKSVLLDLQGTRTSQRQSTKP